MNMRTMIDSAGKKDPGYRGKRWFGTSLAMLLAVALSPPPAASEPGEEATTGYMATTDTLGLRLEEAILMALERHPTVAIQRLKTAIAGTHLQEQGAVYDPALRISASKGETKSQRFLGASPDPFELTAERLQYDISLRGELPTGTTLDASASISGSLSSLYADQYTGEVGLTVTQSLLRGFGPGRNLASLRKARIDVELSQLELKAIAEQLIAEVEKAYWNIFLAGQEILIQQRSLELAEKQLSESVERVAVGRLPELELAAVRAETATRKEAMIDAQSRYEQARLRFLFLLNPEAQQTWDMAVLTVDRPFLPVDTLEAISSHAELAVQYRADLQQAQLNLQKNTLELARTRNGLLPRLDLFIALGTTAYAQSFGESMPDPTSPFYHVSAGATFELPLSNRRARAQHARSRHTQTQLALALANMERLVQWDVRSAYVEVLRSRRQIEATRVARDLQEKKLLAEQEKFRVGRSTNLMVLQTQRDFIAGQLNEARAMVAYLEALVNLYAMEGTLLERRGIQPGIE